MIERPLTISGNDKPGVMMSASLGGYINKYVLPGDEVVICTNNDDAYRNSFISK